MNATTDAAAAAAAITACNRIGDAKIAIVILIDDVKITR